MNQMNHIVVYTPFESYVFSLLSSPGAFPVIMGIASFFLSLVVLSSFKNRGRKNQHFNEISIQNMIISGVVAIFIWFIL